MSADPKAAIRLENVIAMLGSAHDGERANAALMATRMLNELGFDWRTFTRRALAKPEAAKPEAELELYLKLLQWDGLTDWECDFVSSSLCPASEATHRETALPPGKDRSKV